MPVIDLVTTIRAPVRRCFDFARDIDLHLKSMRRSGETAVAGKTSGLIGADEEVTWEARHLGIRQRFASRVTAFRPPEYFQDSMVRGAFASFVHDHFFTEVDPGTTVMRDVLTFRSPFGVLGQLVDRFFMTGYLRRLLDERRETVKLAAEQAHGQDV